MSQPISFLSTRLEFEFPATNTHHGIPLGDGTFGALIWGEDADIRVTINRQDYWDHRGGMDFHEEATYANLKRWLEAGDEESLRKAFEDTRTDEHTPARPTRLPMGRIDLRLAAPFRIEGGGLDMARGEAVIEFAPGGVLRAVMSSPRGASEGQPVLVMGLRGTEAAITAKPVYHEAVLQHFRQYGFPEAQVFDEEAVGEVTGRFTGWVQECPGEPAMCVGCLSVQAPGKTDIYVCAVYGGLEARTTGEEAKAAARTLLIEASRLGYDKTSQREAEWWRDYWKQCPRITLPDRDRELLYYLGMYKLPGLSWPGGPAATLQGPWVEEYVMPPWSSDYHFNINVQECYWPAYGGNQLQALQPLVEMIQSWLPQLRANAKAFVGIEDGLQLPHAVDDRCRCMGGFWTGSIDHGSTAWTGQLFWQLYRYSMDEQFLREVAYPFLKGAMRVYEAMLEEQDGKFVLPVSVSPEYGGSGMSAWGRNASFQLANIHFLCNSLAEASVMLGVDEADRRRWQDISARLPLAATDPSGGQIWLWEGQPLAESHRHQSHLAGLHPFDIFDLDDPQQQALLNASFDHLTRMGMGLWSGWCFPWVSILFSRLGRGDMADLVLGLFRRLFLNQGYASTHDAVFRGFTLMAGRPLIMQIEATMAAATAVMEMLAHTRRGVLHLFAGVPHHWLNASFEGIRVEGAFLVSAWRDNRETQRVEVASEAGATLRLANPFGGPVRVRHADGRAEAIEGDVLDIPTEAGDKLVLTPDPAGGATGAT